MRDLRDHVRGARLALIAGAGHDVQLERADEASDPIRDVLVSLKP